MRRPFTYPFQSRSDWNIYKSKARSHIDRLISPQGPVHHTSLILHFSAFGLIVGITISAYHAVCTGSFDGFLLRPFIGLLCGFIASSVHMCLLRVSRKAPGRLNRSNPLLYAVQFTAIMYFLLMGTEFIAFPERLHDPVHRYWILSAVLMTCAVSTLVFIYQTINQTFSASLKLLEKYHIEAIRSLVTILETRDPWKKGHSERVLNGCELVAVRLGLSKGITERLKRAALMHDLGMIFIDESLIRKDTALTTEELSEIRFHPFIVERILAPLNVLSWETRIIKASQLFIYSVDIQGGNGGNKSGNLKEFFLPGKNIEELPLPARILSAVDFYDTLTHQRPYRDARDHQETIELMRKEAGARFDRCIVEVLAELRDAGLWSDSGDSAPSISPEEEKILLEVKKVTRGLNTLNAFSRIIGAGSCSDRLIFILIFLTCALAGALMGVIIFASTAQPQWISLFIYQGLLTGIILFVTGSILSLIRKARGTITGGHTGTFLSYLAGGIVASLMCLYAFIKPVMGYGSPFADFSLLYLCTTSLFCGITGVIYRSLQSSLSALLIKQEKLQNIFFNIVCALSYALESVDAYTKGHSDKVGAHSRRLGECLGLGDEELEKLEKAALLHDIGKMGISKSIINKKARLTESEYEIIKSHPVIGARTLESVTHLSELADLVKSHHECYDGSGYPENRKHSEIPLFSRIISVADSYDAMVSDRPYRKGLPHDDAIAELVRCAGTQFDPELVRLFVKSFGEGAGILLPQA